MKKVSVLMLIIGISILMLLGCSSAIEDDELLQEAEENSKTEVVENEYVEGELILSLEEPSDSLAANTSDLTANQNLTLEESNQDFEVVGSLLSYNEKEKLEATEINDDFKAEVIDKMGYVYLVEYSTDFESIVEAMDKLEKNLVEEGKEIRYIEPNYKFDLQREVQSDNNFHNKQEWHYEMINAPKAWDLTTGLDSVKMSAVDTGVDEEHINLANFVNQDLSTRFSMSNLDPNGHGTHVAGTMASYGDVSGVMQEATLIDVKVLCPYTQSTTDNIAKGILHSAEVGADVINLSLGGRSYSQTLKDATEVAYENDSIMVAAAGNEGADSISYPAAYEHVISVGAVDINQQRADFSNIGEKLEFMAPGVDVYSTKPDNDYDLESGTSMASPHIAGVVGLMRSVDADITLEEVRAILSETAQEVGNSEEYGYGIVDAYQAVLQTGDFDDYQSNYDDVYIRGTLNDWDTTEMELVADNTWEVEASFAAGDDERFKFDIYGDWSLNYGDNNGDGYGEQDGDDIPVDQAGDYIITFNDETKEYNVELESGNGYDSNYDDVYLRGTLNDWSTTEMELVDDNTWEVEASFYDGDNERFKFDIHGDWSLNYGDNNGDGYGEQDGDDIPVEEGDYTIRFNDETKAYTVE